MARVYMRELFRFRHTIFIHSKPNFISSPFEDTITTSLKHQNLTLLQKCQNTTQLSQIQAHLITSGLFLDPFWAIRLLKHSSDFSDINYTVLIFKCIHLPGTFCVNNVIKAYSFSCIPQQGVVFYFEMLKNGFSPNSYSFVPLFGLCGKMGCVETGLKCHGQALKNGVDCELPVQNSLIHMYGCFGVMDFACKVFGEMSTRDVVSWNSMVDGYVRVGDLGVAHELFDVMVERNVVSWNIMINGYLKGGNPGCALKLFRRMVKMGLRGSDTTIVSCLTACGRSARLNEGKSVHGFLVKTLLKSSVILDTALIDMYSKCQKVDIARRVFDKMENRNLVCWNAMVLGHCIHGNPEDGLNLFAAMVDRRGSEIQEAVLPDEITFVGVLCACARAGMLTEGRNYLSQMIYIYSVKPNFAHYWCIANLYAGAGLIQEAEEILRNIPEEDEDVSSESLVWANLLSSCRFQGDVSLGERIAKSLLDMEPQNFSYHRLLLNVYAVAGRWEDVAKVKEALKERKMGKVPGCNLVDLKEIVHKFKVGDYLQEGIEEVNMMLVQLAQRPSLLTTSSKHPSLPKKEAGS